MRGNHRRSCGSGPLLFIAAEPGIYRRVLGAKWEAIESVAYNGHHLYVVAPTIRRLSDSGQTQNVNQIRSLISGDDFPLTFSFLFHKLKKFRTQYLLNEPIKIIFSNEADKF